MRALNMFASTSGVLLVIVFASAAGTARASDSAAEPHVREASVVAPHLSPTDFSAAVNGSHTHLMFFYVPGLPSWRELLPLANEVALYYGSGDAGNDGDSAEFTPLVPGAGADDQVRVWANDARAAPEYKRKFGLRYYPTVLVFPRGPPKFYYVLQLNHNVTSMDIVHAMDRVQGTTGGVPPGLSGIVEDAKFMLRDGGSFTEAAEKLEGARSACAEAQVVAGEGVAHARRFRGALRALRLRRLRKPADYAAALAKVRASESKLSRAVRASALLNRSLEVPDTARVATDGEDPAVEAPFLWTALVEAAEAEADLLQDLAASEVSRVDFFCEVVGQIAMAGLHALGYVAAEVNRVSVQLHYGNTFLAAEARDVLLVKANVLRAFSDDLLETAPSGEPTTEPSASVDGAAAEL